MAGKDDLGRKGETIACEFLRNKGHTILERNKRMGHLEIDIISLDANGIHFVEVKTRRTPVRLSPENCVDLAKQKRIARAAALYLGKYGNRLPHDSECFCDIIGITFDGVGYTLNYIEQAYIPLIL